MIQLLHVIHFQLLSNAQTLKTASPNRHRRLDMGELLHPVVLRRCKQQRRGDDKTYCYPSQSFVCLIVPVSCVFEGIGSHWNTISMVACHSYSIHVVGATTAYIWGKTWILLHGCAPMTSWAKFRHWSINIQNVWSRGADGDILSFVILLW